jgi:acetamidase/formamidase
VNSAIHASATWLRFLEADLWLTLFAAQVRPPTWEESSHFASRSSLWRPTRVEWIQGGNLDNKDLVAGTTLFLPVHAPGALLLVGDGHAGQGNGEVDTSALETSLIRTFQLVVRKDLHLRWPRAETPSHYIPMAFNEDLDEATKIAVREMIDFLLSKEHLSRDDAYMLASVAADLRITKVVDLNKGVHASIPKAILHDK